MRRTRALSLAILTILAVTVAVIADVIINPDGSAFVGKGDVQSAFGWNNAQLQANAAGVTFSATLSQTFTQNCYRTGEPPINPIGVRTGTATLDSSIIHNARVHHQIDGFLLDPPDEDAEWSDIEWEGGGSGDPGGSGCPGGPSVSHPGGPPIPGPVEYSALYVTFGGVTKQIYP